MSNAAQMLRDMGPTKLVAIGLVAIALLGAGIMLVGKLSKPAMSPIFGGLESEDSAKIAGKLEMMGVYYELRDGGSQILVPSNRVLSLRMSMAEEGLPNGSSIVGYEIFDKSEGIGASSFINDVNLLRALEGELARTIGAFSSVESARVHLVLPRHDLFSRSKQDPSASVVLKMKGTKTLSRSEVGAITHLVATAVPGLHSEKITIVDTQGRPFKLGAKDDNDPGMVAATTEEYRLQYEKKLKGVVEELVGRIVGVGSVEAQITADIDFDRTITNSETYDPDGQVARSVQTVEEREVNNGSESNVSVTNNLPGSNAESGAAGGGSVERVDEVTNFEISKTIKNHISETGTVKRLSVAVLVDQAYKLDEATGEYITQERSPDQLKQIETLVKSAVGFDASRGDVVEVVNMPFSSEVQGITKEKPFEWLRRDLGNIIQTLVIGVVAILVILLIVKPMVRRAFEITKAQSDEADLQMALSGGSAAAAGMSQQYLAQIEEEEGEGDSIIDLGRFEEKMKSSSLGAINDIVERHPEETVTIIRSWLDKNS